MSAKVCPQRIIKEAIRLLNECSCDRSDADHEAMDNVIVELEGLEKALYRDGIVNIVEWRD